MQRTILCAGGGISNTYGVGASTAVYYSPLGSNEGPVGGTATSTIGTGAYGTSQFACVMSKLYVAVGKRYTQNGALQSQINVGGTTPAAGNLNVSSGPATQNGSSVYYYDATDIDAITSGQNIGLMETVSGVSGGQVCAASRGVICDTLDQGFTPTCFYTNSPTVFNATPRYTPVSGGNGVSSTVGPIQQYASSAFVACGLQWQTAAGNTDTVVAATCTFAHSPTQGTNADTTMAAKVPSASFVGQMYDPTDIAAVSAGDYYNMHWSGSTTGNLLKLANAGIHMQAAGNNTGYMLSGGNFSSSWTSTNPTYGCFNANGRFNFVWYEAATVVPTSGVFSKLYVNITTNTYASPATLTILNGPSTGDAGTGSGTMPGTGAGSPTPPGGPNIGFNATSLQATIPASTTGWFYDATDIAAFVGGTNQLLLEGNAAASAGISIQAQQINFTAPAHLGLTTQGVG